MKKLKLIALAGGALLLGLLCAYHPIPLAKTVEAASDQASGRVLYQRNCASCHGADGRAQTARGRLTHSRNISAQDWQEGNSDEDIAEAIRTGPKKMPAFAGKLSAGQINAVVRYVRSLKK
jgi:Cytochrome c, mono- and diheme variants